MPAKSGALTGARAPIISAPHAAVILVNTTMCGGEGGGSVGGGSDGCGTSGGGGPGDGDGGGVVGDGGGGGSQ